MFEQTFKNIDDVLWKEAGCTTELDYTEQTSWLLFLKYLDDLEQERALEAELAGKPYEFIIDEAHSWSAWAAPKKANTSATLSNPGTLDHDNALIGDDLIDYVNRKLFPYLQSFKQRATSPDTIEYKIGEIFSEIKNRFQSGYSLRDALEYIDELRFRSQQEKHELSHLYEAKIKNMGNAGRNGGEYYTPRPLIRAIIQVVKPKIGDRIYDGACGSAGFLCESYDYLRRGKLTTKELKVADMNLPENEPEIVTSSRFLNQKSLKENSIFPVGTTIFPKRGGAILTNKKRLTTVPICTDLNIMGVIPSNILLPKFLYFYFLNIDMRELGSGSSIPQINNYDIEPLIISFPSLPKQKRIVAILDEAFEGIDRAIANTEKNLANSRELFESYRNSILTQDNKQWEETTLGAEIDLMTGFPFKSNGYTDSDQSIRLLRGDNIVQGALRWDDVKKWPESEINEYLSYQLKEGDVVLAMDRPWVKAGLKHAMISSDDLPCLLVQRTACLRGKKNINNRFLMYLIGSHSFIQHILSNQTGIGVPHISGKQIQSFKFLKPFLSEQNFISDSLDELRSKSQRLETIYRQKLAALNELKQSILQKAFIGELTADTPNQVRKTANEGIAA